MRVTCKENSIFVHDGGKIHRVIYMSVSYEEDSSFVNQIDVVSKDWEFQNHLVNFGIAVASDGQDLICVVIQDLDYLYLVMDLLPGGCSWDRGIECRRAERVYLPCSH